MLNEQNIVKTTTLHYQENTKNHVTLEMPAITRKGERRKGKGWLKTTTTSLFFFIPAKWFCKFPQAKARYTDRSIHPSNPLPPKYLRGNNRAPPIIHLCTTPDCNDLPPTTYPGEVSSLSSSKDHEAGGLPLPSYWPPLWQQQLLAFQ